MIEMIDAIGPVSSSKGPEPLPQIATGPVLGNPDEPPPSSPPPAAISKPQPPAPAPEPAPSSPPPSTPEPPSEPIEPPNDFAPPAPAPPKKTVPPKTSKPSEPKKPQIKVNLKVESRKNNSTSPSNAPSTSLKKSTSTSSSSASSNSSRENAQSIASQLGSALQKSGAGGAVQIGPLSSGGGSGNFSSYYSLIRKQMYDNWDRPVHLTQKDLSAQIKITIEKDGRISNVTLVSGSGIRDFDESIMTAAKRVGKIREPLPEGLDHEITIRFKLDD